MSRPGRGPGRAVRGPRRRRRWPKARGATRISTETRSTTRRSPSSTRTPTGGGRLPSRSWTPTEPGVRRRRGLRGPERKRLLGRRRGVRRSRTANGEYDEGDRSRTLNGNRRRDDGEPFHDLDGDGHCQARVSPFSSAERAVTLCRCARGSRRVVPSASPCAPRRDRVVAAIAGLGRGGRAIGRASWSSRPRHRRPIRLRPRPTPLAATFLRSKAGTARAEGREAPRVAAARDREEALAAPDAGPGATRLHREGGGRASRGARDGHLRAAGCAAGRAVHPRPAGQAAACRPRRPGRGPVHGLPAHQCRPRPRRSPDLGARRSPSRTSGSNGPSSSTRARSRRTSSSSCSTYGSR